MFKSIYNKEKNIWESATLTQNGIPVTPEWVEANKPFPSWSWNDDIQEYESPVPKPKEQTEIGYIFSSTYFNWNEEKLSWVELKKFKYQSWSMNKDGYWIPPVKMPLPRRDLYGNLSCKYKWDEESSTWVEYLI